MRSRNALLPAFAVACLGACSSSSAPSGAGAPCNQAPFACPSGQTCWPVDASGNFACLGSKAGAKVGDGCVDTAGSPTCGDAMICLAIANPQQGTCAADCDPALPGRSCSANEICVAVAFASGGPQIHACVTLGAADAGAE